MNMHRMLNVFIVIFLVINLGLYYYINFMNAESYEISVTERELFNEVMDEQNVRFYTNLPEYSPRPPLIIRQPVVQEIELLQKMFGEDQWQTSFNDDLSQHIYETEKEQLSVDQGRSKGRVVYLAKEVTYIPENFTEEGYDGVVKTFVDDFTYALVSDIAQEPGVFELTDTRESMDRSAIIYYFNERYNGELLFCNEVIVKVVKELGITEARTIRYVPYAFEEGVQELRAIDEAFYSLIASTEKDKETVWDVTDIEVGYYLGTDDSSSLYNLSIEPHYRLKLRSGETFHINAYSNELTRDE